MKTQPQDQADVLAANETLTNQVAALEADKVKLTSRVTELETANATLTTERDTAKSELATASARVTTLEGEKTTLTAERDDWKAKAEPVQKQVAAKLAELGIRQTSAPGATASERPLTATEKCMAAKGK